MSLFKIIQDTLCSTKNEFLSCMLSVKVYKLLLSELSITTSEPLMVYAVMFHQITWNIFSWSIPRGSCCISYRDGVALMADTNVLYLIYSLNLILSNLSRNSTYKFCCILCCCAVGQNFPPKDSDVQSLDASYWHYGEQMGSLGDET